MFTDAELDLATKTLAALRARGLKLATAESCTGGLIAALLTEIPGSSDVVERGFVTYSNTAKIGLLNVGYDTLAKFGAVSAEVAAEMAQGALARSAADVAVSVTGVAGPGGGTVAKPVGLVHVGLARRGHSVHTEELRWGDRSRSDIRRATVDHVLTKILTTLAVDVLTA